MRRRPWVLVAFGLFILAVLGIYTGWRATRANEKLKALLLTKIQPFVTPESGIKSLEINLSSVRLYGVRLIPRNQAFELDIENIEIGYRFWNVLRYGFAPQRIAHEIMLIHPVFTYYEDRHVELANEEPSLELLQNLADEFNTVKSFTVIDAELAIADSSKQLVLGRDLDGWMQIISLDSTRLRLSGKLLESQSKNLQLEAKLNLRTVQPTLFRWSVEPSQTPESLPFLIPDFIQVLGGILSGSGEYVKGKEHTGNIEINQGAFCFQNRPFCFNQVQFHGQFIGNQVVLQGKIDDFNGSKISVQGTITHFLKPQLDVNFQSESFRLKPFFQKLTPKSTLTVIGTGRFQLDAKGALNNPEIRGSFFVRNLDVSRFRFDRFSISMALQDSVLIMETEGVQENGIKMNHKSELDFSKPNVPSFFSMKLDGDFINTMPSGVRSYFSHLPGSADALLSGPLSNLKGQLTGIIQAETKAGRIMRFNPVLSYGKHNLEAEIRSNGPFVFRGDIDQIFTLNYQWHFEAFGIEYLLENLSESLYQQWFEGQTIRSELEGHSAGWTCQTTSRTESSDSLVWQWTLRSKRMNQGRHQIDINGNFYPDSIPPVPFEIVSLWNQKSIQIKKLTYNGYINGLGAISFSRLDPFELKIHFNHMGLDQIHPFVKILRPYSGILTGDIDISGTRQAPVAGMDLHLSQGKFHDLNGFAFDLTGQWNADTLQNVRCHFARNDTILLDGGVYNFSGDSLTGSFRGEYFDFGNLISAVSGKSNWGGRGRFDMQIKGLAYKPVFSGTMVVLGGHIGRFQYDSLGVQFEDTLKSGWEPYQNNLFLKKGRIERSDNVKLAFNGKIPLFSSDDMDLSILAQGDLLKVLSDVADFVKKGEGQGNALIRIGGRPESPVLGGASVSIENGSVKLTDIVREIKELYFSAQLQPEDRFFRIYNLSGKVHDRQFRLWNVKPEQGLPVLNSEKLGVHFGHIQFETDKRGLQLHMPGLMEKRDEGMIAFEGFDPQHPFVIAGSNNGGPTFQGTLNLNNVRLTYPFYRISDSNANGTNGLIDFLEHVTWDIRVRPFSDVHYIRSIESPLGNVYADLQLKKDYGRLNIQGMIDEGSLQVFGNLESTEGNIEVLDLYFRPERIIFYYPKGVSNPIVSGRAYTTVIDSMGNPSTVWLTLTTVDDATGLEKEGGSWKNILFRFSADNPNLARSEADLLAAMGYSSSQMKERAYDALGLQVENLVFRPIFRPLEREMRRYLGLDVVRFSSKFSSNLMQLQAVEEPVFDPKYLFKSSRVTLGKYLAPGLFITYSGQIQTAWKYQYHDEGLGFRHAISLEYTFRPDLFLEMEYTYDSKLLLDRREDKRIWLRHVFPF